MDIVRATWWVCISGIAGTLAASLCTSAGAQGVPYKVTTPDGRVIYTDRPPADARSVRPLGVPVESDAADDPFDRLPFALRQVVQRYPVTLYSAPGCAPCDLGRLALQQRGVPFRERRVEADSVAELQRREGTASLPVLRVGREQLLGFEASEWRRTLDAAGYPAASALPTGWQAPPAQPLKTPEAPAGASAAARAPAAPQPVAPGASGFRF